MLPKTQHLWAPTASAISGIPPGFGSVARDTKLYGPFILSLYELEQLGTLPQKRVSELLLEWTKGPERSWPSHSFYTRRTKGQPISNEHVARLADQNLDDGTTTLFGRPVRQPQV